MSNIDALANPLRDLWNRATSSVGPAPAPPTPSASPSASPSGSTTRPQSEVDAAYDTALERLPSPSVGIPALLAKLDPVGTKLDQVQAAMKGPYQVNGATVYSGAQFRMANGWNKVSATDAGVLQTVAEKAGVASELPLLQEGRGSPAGLVKLTQALIDRGELAAAPGKSVPDQIHDLQWRFGIGVDCAGYVYKAVAAAHGDPAKLGLKPTDYENFTGLPENAHFEPVKPWEARSGDVIVLRGRGGGDPGHNLIVRSHATLAPGSTSVTARWPGAAGFLETKATVHVYEVDSSFGARDFGDPHGGVRRDVLLHTDNPDKWCMCTDTHPPRAGVDAVPYGEMALTGFFRPKRTP